MIPIVARASFEALINVSYFTGLTKLLMRRRARMKRCTILLYHRVDTPTGNGFASGRESRVPPREFHRQMEFLKRRFHVLALKEAVSHLNSRTPFPAGSLVVSFDDGYRDNLINAYPILSEYGIPFSVFVTTDYLGNQAIAWWERVRQAIADTREPVTLDLDSLTGTYDLARTREKNRLYAALRRLFLARPQQQQIVLDHLQERLPGWPREPQSAVFLSIEELRKLAESPLVEVGSHSLSHPSLPRLEPDAMLREVRDSRRTLEEELGGTVDSFAYPYGERADFSVEVARAVRESGYRCALTGVPGTVRHGDDIFQLNRISIGGRDNWPRFLGKLSGVTQHLRSIGKAVYRGDTR